MRNNLEFTLRIVNDLDKLRTDTVASIKSVKR
jgi:hypothetical protein